MLAKIIFLSVLAVTFSNVCCLSLGKSSESDEDQFEIPESLKEFVQMVDKHNLNVSIIGSQKKYGSRGWVKEELGVTIHMPANNLFLTESSMNDAKIDKFFKKLEKISNKEKIGVRSRVIAIKNGEGVEKNAQTLNDKYLIDSTNYNILTNYKNGVQGFVLPENDTHEILYNYVIKDKKEFVKNIQVITGKVIIEELDKSDDFPPEIMEEMKKILPKLWMSVEDSVLLARLLVQHLDEKFQGKNHQAMVGVDKFALSNKLYANLNVANTNVVVFY